MEAGVLTKILNKLSDFEQITNSASLYLIVDANDKICFCSQGFLNFINLPEIYFLDKSIHEIFEQFKSANLSNHYVAKLSVNNQNIWFSVQSFDLNPSNFLSKASLYLFQDITEIKNNENHLEYLNQTKNKFFSLIAHDLKGPVTTIMGLSRFLVDEVDNFDEEQLRDIASTIYQVSENTYNLILNLLEWSRIQTGKISMNPVSISLKAFTRNILTVLAVQADAKNIGIEMEIPARIKVFADENMLESIIRNLVSNAIKFTYPGGKISVMANQSDDFITISVLDNGKGIPESDKGKIFINGLNFSTAGTNEEKGTGLGLILCKEFVEKHHGNIWFESREGEGSRFHFTIPVSAKVFSV